jgi:hypothetical protein
VCLSVCLVCIAWNDKIIRLIRLLQTFTRSVRGFGISVFRTKSEAAAADLHSMVLPTLFLFLPFCSKHHFGKAQE